MIDYYVPHSIFPAGYLCDPKQRLQFAALANQKNHVALYLMCVYLHGPTSQWFREKYEATGKKPSEGLIYLASVTLIS